MTSKVKGMFELATRSSFNGGRTKNIDDLEVRPGGMLVQRRSSEADQISPVSIPTIKVRVKYDSSYHDIHISSQASFGELKKMIATHTGVHHLDQKLIYKKMERDSKQFLDVAGVKDGSKLVLIEDITNRERRRLDMLKSAKIDRAVKSLQEIILEVDKLHREVKNLEYASSGGKEVSWKDVETLTEILMTKLVMLDGLVTHGELKLQKREQECRIKMAIETLDTLKLKNSYGNGKGGEVSLHKNDDLTEKPMQKQPFQPKNRNVTVEMPVQAGASRHSESVVITTKWETFD
ncbi:hypothetical protein K2173_021683 [Erythroxylum novogranatense]|uniref:Ubiquitin-like domain-containing protein n=1 Tax=Erythroxylum novogranatense TaxID=1862640 RepID=A0AAV8TH12_9ROSI|nr:hypothetical protein K2173_021683 [Erythroxylum novogranatense]